MSDFRDGIKYNEKREDELEKSNLKARIDNRLNKFRKLNYENIKEELEILKEVLKDYELLKYYQEDEEFDEDEYELLKFKIDRLSKKQAEIESEMNKDASWEDYKDEELRKEQKEDGEERD